MLRNAALDLMATGDIRDAGALAAVPGLGPRALAKHGAELLRLIAAYPPGRYLVPMHQGDAEILERLEAGERIFRPGAGERGRQTFEALVSHLRELRDRGLIDMPERTVAHAAEAETGAYLLAGPCHVTEAGRAALLEFRQGNRRLAERRAGERRGVVGPPGEAERRQAERRQAERRERDRQR